LRTNNVIAPTNAQEHLDSASRFANRLLTLAKRSS
jgi:hypothetical protein